jgi:hypothetical protein
MKRISKGDYTFPIYIYINFILSHRKKKRQSRTKLGLDAALKQFTDNLDAEPDKAFEGWSEARIKSFKLIDQNPNSYYYRFNEPGEVQKTGQWTEVIYI